MAGDRMSVSKRRAIRAVAVAAVLLLCLPVVLHHLSARQPTLWWSGADYAEGRWVRVKVDHPLGDRQVLDALTGDPVPRA